MPQLTHAQYELLENAIRNGTRIVAFRRGTEFVVVPLALRMIGGQEAIAAVA
jgi:hypothetical protein